MVWAVACSQQKLWHRDAAKFAKAARAGVEIINGKHKLALNNQRP